MIGAVASSATKDIEITQYIATLRTSAVMILPPPGLHPEPEKIYGFYKCVSEKVTLPVAIYNSPGSSGVDIAPESMSGIAEPPSMEYMKEFAGDICPPARAMPRLTSCPERGRRADTFNDVGSAESF